MAKRKASKKTLNLKQLGFLAVAAIIALCVLYFTDRAGIYTFEQLREAMGYDIPKVVSGEDISVHFIDVGQGDCSFIVSGDKTVLIDCGEKEYASKVSNYIKAYGFTRLDYVIMTHPHSDHAGGMSEIIEDFDIGQVIMPDIPDDKTPTTKFYEQFLTALDEKGCAVKLAEREIIELGEAELEIFPPDPDEDFDDYNNYSVVSRLTYGKTSFLFTGDMEKKNEKYLLSLGVNLSSDVLKVAHHGSSTSSTEDFLNEVNPEICVIMCGDNGYNHPHEDTVKRLENYTDKIYRTDYVGTVVITSNGETLKEFFENEAEE